MKNCRWWKTLTYKTYIKQFCHSKYWLFGVNTPMSSLRYKYFKVQIQIWSSFLSLDNFALSPTFKIWRYARRLMASGGGSTPCYPSDARFFREKYRQNVCVLFFAYVTKILLANCSKEFQGSSVQDYSTQSILMTLMSLPYTSWLAWCHFLGSWESAGNYQLRKLGLDNW